MYLNVKLNTNCKLTQCITVTFKRNLNQLMITLKGFKNNTSETHVLNIKLKLDNFQSVLKIILLKIASSAKYLEDRTVIRKCSSSSAL